MTARRLLAAAATLAVAVLAAPPPAAAASYVPISGAGSTWSANAVEQWRKNVKQYGMQVNYQASGSSDGRNQFRNGTVDFAVSEIPYGLKDGGVTDHPPQRKYAYMPIVAGGTSFMYHLKIGGRRVTNLRLSGETLAKIFTGVVTKWDDPAVKADNPGLALPARRVVPVVRSDGSGTTAQLTTWLSKQHQGLWDAYCARLGRATPCGVTSNYPVDAKSGMTAQSGSLGVSGYVAQSQNEGTITYVEYSYALNTRFPVAKVLNRAGYYVEPTPENVAVALLEARINTDPGSPEYLTQILDGVYANPDRRSYVLSSYSYMVVPTAVEASFNAEKGRTLGAFAYYFLCGGQRQAPLLGYSPLPINLVRAGLDQVRRIPGAETQQVDIAKCDNPTFSSDGTNTLAKTAPQPAECDRKGATQCDTGTGGAKTTTTPVTTGGTTGGGTTAPTGTGSTGGTAAGPRTGTATGPLGAGGAPVNGAPAGGTAVDPDTGQLVTAGGATADAGSVAAGPVLLAAGRGWRQQHTLAALSGALLLGVTLGPPLLARRLAGREPR